MLSFISLTLIWTFRNSQNKSLHLKQLNITEVLKWLLICSFLVAECRWLRRRRRAAALHPDKESFCPGSSVSQRTPPTIINSTSDRSVAKKPVRGPRRRLEARWKEQAVPVTMTTLQGRRRGLWEKWSRTRTHSHNVKHVNKKRQTTRQLSCFLLHSNSPQPTPTHWINNQKLCSILIPNQSINHFRYNLRK